MCPGLLTLARDVLSLPEVRNASLRQMSAIPPICVLYIDPDVVAVQAVLRRVYSSIPDAALTRLIARMAGDATEGTEGGSPLGNLHVPTPTFLDMVRAEEVKVEDPYGDEPPDDQGKGKEKEKGKKSPLALLPDLSKVVKVEEDGDRY